MTEPTQGGPSNQGDPADELTRPVGGLPPSAGAPQQGTGQQGAGQQQGTGYQQGPGHQQDPPYRQGAQPSPYGSPGAPPAYPGPGGSDPDKPGSKAWVQQRFGRTADFAERILPGLVDALITAAAAFIPVILGLVLIVSGIPETYDCGYLDTDTCEVPGSGSGGLIALGVILILLSFLISLAVAFWNRVWRVTKTGQSIGKKANGLKVIDAESGGNPELGPAVLRELIHQFAGIISWIWMLIDDDDRTLADIVGKTHVIHVDES